MDGNVETWERLALTLAGSLIVHLALLFGVQVQPQPDVRPPSRPIEARIVERPAVPPLAADRPAVAQAPPAEGLELRIDRTIPAVSLPPAAPPAPEPPRAAEAAPSAAAAEKQGDLPAIAVPLIEDPTYYPASDLDVLPRALQTIVPGYPERALKEGVAGSVVLLLLVDEGGTVREASVEVANPPGYFEESALAAFAKVRFSPAQRKGKVVKSRVRIKVSYDLTGGPDKTPGGKVE